MGSGVDLIIASFCNATFCDVVYDNYTAMETRYDKEKIALKELEKEVNGKHLKIGTFDNYPLSWAEPMGNEKLIGRGVAFDLVEILRKRFNFTYDVVTPSRNFEFGGIKPEDSLIGLLTSNKIDMAAAFLPSLYEFRDRVTFSSELDEGTWVMMLRRPKESAEGSGLLAPFNDYVWYLILAAVLSYGPIISFLTLMRSKLVSDKERRISIGPSFWYVYGAFIKQGTSLAPEANSTRVLFATWWMFVILLSAFYTANLTAFLTLSKFTLVIETPKDLLKKNYRWVAAEGSAVECIVKDPDEELYYLSKMITNGRAEFRSVVSGEQFLPMVSGGAVLVKEQLSVDHLMYADYLNKLREGIEESERCTYVVAPYHFMKLLRSFAFPKDSPLHNLFNPVLESLVQAGIVKFLTQQDLPSTKICPLNLQSKERRLRNSDLMMTYMIMVVGLAAAVAIFIGEVIIRRYMNLYYKKNPKHRKKKESKEPFSYNYDDSRPPPYEELFGKNYKSNGKSRKKIVNGREYWVVNINNGDTRLIPVRTPSAFLYQRNIEK